MFQGFFNRKPEYLSGKSDCLSLNIYIYTHAIYVSPENDTKKKTNERMLSIISVSLTVPFFNQRTSKELWWAKA
jgi:hypothetical protein